MKRKKGKLLLAGILLLFFAVLYQRSYLLVNSKWKDAPVEYFSVGETVPMGTDILMDATMEGYAIAVTKAEVLEYTDYLKKYGGEDEYTYIPDRIYDVTVLLKNEGAAEGTGVSLTDFYLTGSAVCASLNWQLLDLSNPNLGGNTAIALRENSELEIHLPFNLVRSLFREKNWENLAHYDMQLAVTLYPTKKLIRLI